MNQLWMMLILAVAISCSGFSVNGDPVKNSDILAEEFTLEIAKIYPEIGSSLGLEQFDSQGTIVSNDFDKREYKILKTFNQRIETTLPKVINNELKVDLLVLNDRIQEEMKLYELEEKYKVLPFSEVSKTLFNNLFSLLKPGVPEHRQKAALERFKMYVDPPGDARPFALAYIDYFNFKVQQYSGAHFYPYKPSVEKYLRESPVYLGGIAKLLAQLDDKTYLPYFQKFIVQVQAYDTFVQKRILPYSRHHPQLPKETYLNLLSAQGVDESPEHLIKFGKNEFNTLYKEFNKLGKKLAKKYEAKGGGGRDVILKFKQSKITSPVQALSLYQTAAKRLQNIIKEHDLLTLPEQELQVRIASQAESRANPVPHLDIPSLKNHGEQRAEFIIPVDKNGELPFDDFSYEFAATPLTAHEGRPGHDLQFSYILDHPISTIRARYAQNATNVEGWALYAEDLVFPYLSLEEQLVTLQTRLWRVARYFLDPMVQLGKADKNYVLKTMDKIGVSKHMAALEYNRYAFESPGQATGYYHGLLEIQKLKKSLSSEAKLNLKCFNDTLISLGLMPYKYIGLLKERFNGCLEK